MKKFRNWDQRTIFLTPGSPPSTVAVTVSLERTLDGASGR